MINFPIGRDIVYSECFHKVIVTLNLAYVYVLIKIKWTIYYNSNSNIILMTRTCNNSTAFI